MRLKIKNTCSPCEVEPAWSISYRLDLASLLDRLGPLVELGELDLGLRAFLTKAEAEEDSEEEREQGHHDVTMVTSAPGPLGLVTSHPCIYPASGQVYRCMY